MHDNAFGISINNNNLFNLHQYANQKLENIDFGINVYNVDFIREAKDIDIDKIIIDLSKYDYIWGQQNPEPLIAIDNIFIKKEDVQVIGKNKDTLKFSKNGVTFIKFHAKKLIPLFEQYDDMKINLIGKANCNEWLGNITLQIMIEDLEVENAQLAF